MSVGQINKTYVSAISYLDQREILNKVLDITNEEYSFLDIMELTGRDVVTANPTYHHFTNREMYAIETISGTPGGTGPAPTIVLAAANGTSSIRAGSLVLAANKKVGYVTSFTADGSGDQVSLQSVDGTTLGLADTQKLAVFSNAHGEGSSEPDPIKYGTDKLYNQVQIFKTTTELTDIELANQIEVDFDGNPYYMNKAMYDALMKHRADISNTLLLGRRSTTLFSDSSPTLVDGGSRPVQTTGGLNEYIEDNGITNSSVTIGLSYYETLAKQLKARRAPMDYWIFEGIYSSVKHDNFLKALGSAGTMPGRMSLDVKKLDFGVQEFNLYSTNWKRKYLPVLDHQNLLSFTGSAGFDKRVFYVPEGKQKAVKTGEMVDRFRCRYMKMASSQFGDSKYREYRLGSYADVPTSGESVLKVVHESRFGFEALGSNHFALADLS